MKICKALIITTFIFILIGVPIISVCGEGNIITLSSPKISIDHKGQPQICWLSEDEDASGGNNKIWITTIENERNIKTKLVADTKSSYPDLNQIQVYNENLFLCWEDGFDKEIDGKRIPHQWYYTILNL